MISLFAQNRDGTQRVELPQATIDSYTERLNQPGSLYAEIAPRKLADTDGGYTIALAEDLEPGVHELGVRRAGTIVWLGPLLALSETDGPDGPRLSVAAEGLAAYLWRGYIVGDLPGSSPAGQYHDTEQTLILQRILDYFVAKGDNWANLDVDDVWDTGGTVSRTRTEYQSYRGLNIGDEIRKLAEVDGGFDWAIDPANRKFQVHYPRRGRRRDDVTFNPANIIGFRREIDATPQASSVIGYGDGMAEGTVIRRVSDSVAVGTYGLTEGIWSGSGVTRASTLDAQSRAYLRTVSAPPQLLSVTVRFGPNLPWGSFEVGDEVRVEWPASIWRPVDEYRRIVGIDHHPHPDETATVHLDELGVT